jgi:hypothetical protein
VLFKYKHSPKPALQPHSEFYGQIFVEALAVQSDLLAVGDHIKSVVVAKLASDDHKEFLEISRNVEAHSISSLAIIDERRFLAADTVGNIMALTQVQNPIYNDTRFQTLEVSSASFFGSMITCLVPGSLTDVDTSVIHTPVVYSSQSGSVGIIGQFRNRAIYEELLVVQSRLETVEEHESSVFLGRLAKPTEYNMVNGDILFRILEKENPEELLTGLSIPSDQLFKIIESLYNSV